MNASKRIVLIRQTMGERIDKLRAWANDREVMADESLEPRPIISTSKMLRMNDLV